MRYYLNLPIPPSLTQRIKSVESRWQGQAGSEPHITLMIPRSILPGVDEELLVSRLREALPNVHPFLIKMGGCGYFGEKNTIYIAVERSPEFSHCHEVVMRATQGLLEPVGEEAYASIPQPHITLATRLSSEQGAHTWREVSSQDWTTGEFSCRQVQLLRKGPGKHRWVVMTRLPLGP